MYELRRLVTATLLAGVFAGLVLFAIQRFTVIPLIETAEKFEPEGRGQHLKDAHEPAEWQPEDGWQRISLTAAATVLARKLGISASLSFGALPDPRYEPGDVVAATREALGIDQDIHIIETLSIGLGPEAPIAGTTRTRQVTT